MTSHSSHQVSSFYSSAGLRLVALGFLAILSSLTASENVALLLLNDSKANVNLYWVNPTTKETVHMNAGIEIGPSTEFPLNSFVGHEFEIRELPDTSDPLHCSEAPDHVCRTTSFRIEEFPVVRLNEAFGVELFRSKPDRSRPAPEELVRRCRDAAKRSLADKSSDNEKALEQLMECVQSGVAEELERVQEQITFQATVRTEIASKLENYTCLDDSLDSTPDAFVTSWKHLDEEPRTVHHKHEREASKIHLIENFVRPDECKAMEEAAAATLHRATVADGKGGSRLSDNRKAMQAGIKVPWDQEDDDHPIARLSRRVYDYTNHVLGLNIDEFGQEDLMSIQYFGRGMNDTEPDRYTPHCDGDCTGMPHKTGTRMATLVMYCDVADRGGHTNFRNAGVHVKPSVGSGIFFSYINPETFEMDTGFTEHSGCPVFEGKKKIVTQWVRLGVDSENPWDSFNTLGVKKTETME